MAIKDPKKHLLRVASKVADGTGSVLAGLVQSLWVVPSKTDVSKLQSKVRCR